MNRKLSPKVTLAALSVPGFSLQVSKFEKWTRLQQLSDSTFKNYARAIAEISLHYKTLPEDLSQEQLTDYLDMRVTSARSPSLSEFKHTVYGIRCYLRMFNLRSPLKLPILKKAQPLPGVLSQSECRTLFNAVSGQQRLILMLIYSAGLRMRELIHLQWRDIDPHRMTIFIRRSKGRKDRYVPPSRFILQDLLVFIKGKRGPFVFSRKDQTAPMSASSVARVMRVAVKNAALTKSGLCPHTLRHSYATHLLEGGLDIISIKELLGHDRIETTLVYLHVADIDKQRKISPLDSWVPAIHSNKLKLMQEELHRALSQKKLNERLDSGDQMKLWEDDDA